MKPGPYTLTQLLNNWTAPLAALTVLMGGVVWLTSLHGIAHQNKESIQELRVEFDRSKTEIALRLNDLDKRLGRIEGKLDLLIDKRERR